MPALAASNIVSPVAGQINPHLSHELSEFAGIVGWPPDATNAMAAAIQSALTTAWPVSTTPVAKAASKPLSYLDDYYYRVHVIPRVIALGNVVSAQTRVIHLWNAWFVARTLDSITGLPAGMTLTGGALPLAFAPLQMRDWDLAITLDGPPSIDAALVWEFDNGNAPVLRITATLAQIWAFAPDWDEPVTESLAWATDVLQSTTGAEQRRAIRLAPRREFGFRVLAEGRDRQLLDLSLFGAGGRSWALPIWPDVQLLGAPLSVGAVRINCATAGRDFSVGGLAILRGATAAEAEAAEILAIDAGGLDLALPLANAWPLATRLYPARFARLTEQPKLARQTDRLDRTEVQFQLAEPSDWPAALPATTYLGYPVMIERPDESEDLSHGWQRLLLNLDNGSGPPRITDTAGRGFPVRMHRWQPYGRAARTALRGLLYGLQGRLAALWLPSHAADLTLAAAVTAVDITLDVDNVGYARFGQIAGVPVPGRRDIRIELRDGSAYHRRITGAAEISAAVERLTIDSALGVAVAPAAVARISWLQLCRLDQDTVEIAHITDGEGIATAQAIFRTIRDEELA